MSKQATKISILRGKYQIYSGIEDLSFRGFIENESLKSDFWNWFFDSDISLPLSEEQQEKYQNFLNMADSLMKRKPKIKDKDTDCHIKLSSSDKEVMQKKAKILGLTLSSYIRKTALENKIIVKTDTEMVRQVRKIGVNINQIAYKINKEPTNKRINIGLIELKTYMQMLQTILNKID